MPYMNAFAVRENARITLGDSRPNSRSHASPDSKRLFTNANTLDDSTHRKNTMETRRLNANTLEHTLEHWNIL